MIVRSWSTVEIRSCSFKFDKEVNEKEFKQSEMKITANDPKSEVVCEGCAG